MADALSVISYLAAVVELSYKVINKSIVFATSAGSQYRRTRFGVAGDILYFVRLVDTDALQQMHWNINLWTDKEVLVWRDSYLATCNAVSVAGAIFSTLGLTALQLPDMYTVHWSARALFVASMIMGVLSVSMATSQQHALAMLNDPISIRLWLSRGRPTAYELERLLGKHVMPTNILQMQHLYEDRIRNQGQRRHRAELPTSWREQDKYKAIETWKGLPLESSISVLKAVAMPRHLLDVAVLVFLVGFGLYQLFQWVEDMGGQPIANRNVFIVFIVSVGTFTLYYLYILSNMVDNQAKKAKEFDLNLGGPHKPRALEELEKELEEVQQRMKSLEEQRGAIKRQIHGVVRTGHKTDGSSGGAPETV